MTALEVERLNLSAALRIMWNMFTWKKSASQVHKMQICTMCSFHTEQNLWFSDNFLWNFYIRRGLRKISKFHIFERFGIVFRKRVINIAFLELRPLSNERSDNFTFYRGIHEFLNSFIFENITVFEIQVYLETSKWKRFHYKVS